GDRDADGIGTSAGRVVEVLVADAAEVDHVGSETKRGVAAAVAPVDDDRVGIERAGIAEAAAERGCIVLVNGRLAQGQLDVGWRNITHVDAGAGTRAGPVVVRNSNGDSVAARGRRIHVLVADAAEGEHTGG